ncbi:Cyclin N-terminal domain-containing protein [Mycena indigotica]|uniref:Cyclin N-terminal domain-containing protein n=1 Tax=Mycena indigotica TaxID=2126181 RepID=A0A8H6S0Z9_9AGAR|nr:Cyclin N-terminal domain-containing protein [Mycena indigotica]KAF7289887.1 Cyclin N-terminal domain-containing protein [Mycena indigotica]
MSTTNVPQRRAVRSTRLAGQRDAENANARPSRNTQRAKPLSNNAQAASSNLAGGPSRVTAATAASRAKLGVTSTTHPDQPIGKRKREVLGENATVNRAKAQQKGKEKEIDTNATDKAPTLRATRQPLRTVAGTRHNAVTAIEGEAMSEVKEEPHAEDGNAMLIDHLPPQPALPTVPARKSLVPRENTVATRPSDGAPRRQTRSSLARQQQQIQEEQDDEDEAPAHKRRKTSSDSPEEPEMDEEEREAARLQAEEDAVATRIAQEIAVYANGEPEADPESSPWDDLDADDADDPAMVSEYVVEIFKYLKQVELSTMPNPNYMTSQTELAWKMRGILNDWLIQVHVRFRLLSETLFLCVNIIDRFLSARVVSLAKLQLVGVTCMFIAAKFEEITAPSVTQFLECADSTYTESEILQAERYVLKTLDWNLSFPNPVHFLRRVSKADNYDIKARTLGKYLLEIACLEWRLIAAPPSLLAAAAMWLARIAVGEENWTPNLAHYSSYPESSLLPTANLMLNYILKPPRHEAFYNKYAGKKFSKASIFMRQWALERWDENTTVDLAVDLDQLKNEIRAERVHEEVRLEQEQRQQQKEAAERAERRQKIRDSVALANAEIGRHTSSKGALRTTR